MGRGAGLGDRVDTDGGEMSRQDERELLELRCACPDGFPRTETVKVHRRVHTGGCPCHDEVLDDDPITVQKAWMSDTLMAGEAR